MSEQLIEWIEHERIARNWSIRELAQVSGLSSGTITDVLSGRTNPGVRFCRGIATAINVPAETVFRLAGLLPPKDRSNPTLDELVHIAGQLPDSELDRLLAIARTLYEHQTQR